MSAGMLGQEGVGLLNRGALVRHVIETLQGEGVVGLIAPAGYGKTTLGDAVCSRIGGPVRRVVCSPDRASVAAFFAVLGGVALPVFAGDERDVSPVMASDGIDALAEQLVDGFAQGGLWWVDEVQQLYGTPAFALLVALAQRIRHAPGAGRLLWAARYCATEEGCALGRVSARVGEARLALDLAEVMRFFAGQVSGGDAAALLTLSGGWFPALQAAARRVAAGDTRVLAGEIQPLAADLQGVFQDRVFGALKPSALQLLQVLAGLPRCPLEIVPVLAEEERVAQLPLRLARQGGFLAIDGDILVFKPLLRAVLQAMPEAGGTGEAGELRIRAARWFEARGEPWHALHCLDARMEVERAEADALLGRCHAVLVGQGEAVASWLGALSRAQLRSCPWLALAAGSFAQGGRPAGEAARLLGEAVACFAERKNGLGRLRAELVRVRRGLFGEPGYPAADVLMDSIRGLMADPSLGLGAEERVLTALAEGQYQILYGFSHARLRQAVWPLLREGAVVDRPWARAELVAILAHGESMIGHARRAREILEQAHDLLGQPLPPWTRVYLRMARANVLGLLGCRAAFDHARRGILCEPESVVRLSLAGAFLDIWRLNGLMTAGQLDDAVALAEACLHDVHVAAVPALRGEFLHYLGYAHALRGKVDAAQRAILASREAQQAGGNAFFFWVNTLVAGAVAVLCGHDAEGRQALAAVKGQTRIEGEQALREAAEWLLALSCLRGGDEAGMQTALRAALALNRERDGHVFLWSRLWTPELLSRAVAGGIEPSQARRVARRVFAADIAQDGTWIPILQLQYLGPPCLRIEAQEPFALDRLTPVQQRLLAVLAAAPAHTVPVAELLNLLWPGVPPESARGSLDTALLRFRRALSGYVGPALAARYLVLHNSQLTLRHVEVDTLRLAGHLDEAQVLAESGKPWQAEECLAECLARLDGPVSPALVVHDPASALSWRLRLEQAFVLWSRLRAGQEPMMDGGAALRLHAVIPSDPVLTRTLYRHLRHQAGGRPQCLAHAEQLLQAHERALRERGLTEAAVKDALLGLFVD